MTARSLAGGVLAAVVIAVAVVIFTGGDDDHARVRMVMPTAVGLRDGSDVRVGGVSVGQVDDIGLTDRDEVEIELGVEDEAVRLGRGAAAAIKSQNLLGEKYVALDPGDPVGDGDPVVTIPDERVTTATDLDQVLDVLDADTRTRLAILINEAGIALTGRSADFNALLAKLPRSLSDATRMLQDVVSDNRTLASLISHSDRFLARTVKERGDIRRFVESAQAAAETFAERHSELRQTLARAPGGLSTLRSFLAELRETAGPLGPAARNLSATAPQLTATLSQLEPFRAAARPTLREAKAAAPALSRLGRRATPVIRDSLPTLASFDAFADTSTAITKTLGGTASADLFGVLEGWGRAVQGRDGLGHQFHGKATMGSDALRHILASIPEDSKKKRKQTSTRKEAPAPERPRERERESLKRPVERLKDTLKSLPKRIQELPQTIQELPKAVEKVTNGLLDGLNPGSPSPQERQDPRPLLDFLLKP